ncbi:uncharacterized protein [Palaemon carinicauda]|uniref:uncharacterized protein n=1 Tax=Palaemon carinicauda TaxID=392227 RepID=UPI0035B6A76F
MQTRNSNDFQELKKTICKNYLKDSCPYGKECRFRHPPKHQEKGTGVCKYFLQNKCKRGAECPFLHQKPKPEKKQRHDWLTFCLYFPNGQCKNKECRFLHITEEEKKIFRTTGKIGPHLLEQAMCKALLQDVTLDGVTPTCKEYLQGHCEWMSCPLLHANRQEFSDAIIEIMMEKFEAVLGSPERYAGHHKSAYDTSSRYREPFSKRPSSLRDPQRQDKYASVIDESYGNNYGKKPSWYNERPGGRLECDPNELISSETNRIIKGIYNLMKADAGILRNTDNYEVTDLRLKLNNLAEENARYQYEFSRMHEGDGYKPLIPSRMPPDEFKYQDIVRRLERENMEMRRELSRLHGRDENHLHNGRYDVHQGNFSGAGQAHTSYDRRMYGLPRPVSNHAPTYNPVKQKIDNQLKHNMLKQYKNPQQMKQGASYYGKASYQKYPQVSKKNQQKKTVNNKVNQKPKKPLPNSNQAKPDSASNDTQSKESKEDVELNKKKANSSDTEEKPIVDAPSRNVESSPEDEVKREEDGARSLTNGESHCEREEDGARSLTNGESHCEREEDGARSLTNGESHCDSDSEQNESKETVVESETTSNDSGSEEPEPDAQELEKEEKERETINSDVASEQQN